MSFFKYPVTKKVPSLQTFHGHTVTENYRWLEDPDSADTKQWVEDQVKCTSDFIAGNSPDKEAILKRLNDTVKFDLFMPPFRKGPYLFFQRREITNNQPILWVQDKTLPPFDGSARMLLDPNTIKADGTASLSRMCVSEDGSLLVYGMSYSGSDWITVKVMRTATGEELTDEIKWVKFSGLQLTHDNNGFYYCRYPEVESLVNDATKSVGTEVDAATGQGVYFHKIGDDQSKDICVFKNKECPKWLHGIEITTDGRYLLITPNDSCDPVNFVHIVDLENIQYNEDGTYQTANLVDNQDYGWNYLTNIGRNFFFKTNFKAPKSKIIKIEFPAVINEFPKGSVGTFPGLKVDIVVPEDEGVLDWVDVCGDGKGGQYFIASYMINVCQEIRVMSLDGSRICVVPTPTIGTISSWSGSSKLSDAYYSFTSFFHPSAVWHANVAAMVSAAEAKGSLDTAVEEIKAPFIPGLDSCEYETRQEFYTSKDGTKVSIFIGTKKGRSKPCPMIIYGYGGFNISLVPYFSSVRLLWMQHFGNYAIVNLRGGGEYGDAWHAAGKKMNKQNVFDDFIYAAKYLISEGYTTAPQICINGGSNGGLLVSACALQAPELFGCVVSQVPVADMLRFHKYTIGHAWISDYGDADSDDAMFKYLLNYSPIHNVKPHLNLPAMLITTADHDDRVVPLHSFKLIAELQNVVGSKPDFSKPLMIRIETSAGHGAGKPVSKTIEEWVDIYSFIAAAVNKRME